jgi:hypothetical protein
VGGFDTGGGPDKAPGSIPSNLGARTRESPERKAPINAYNAMACDHLDRYPSIMERRSFNGIRRKIAGEPLTLDDIENRLRQTRDARIHFAIVCASKSCPPLVTRAYRRAGLSAELDAQGRAFVRDPTKNVIDPAGDRLALSQIFEWNRKEFEREAGTIGYYVARFAAGVAADWLKTFSKSPEFLPYDWALNQP